MTQGTVKAKNPRGFGFIKAAHGGGDLFFHCTDLVGVPWEELEENDLVGYVEGMDPRGKGPRATQVERLQRATPLSGDGAPSRWPTLPTSADDDDNTYDWGQSA